jgi:hypothetical protein
MELLIMKCRVAWPASPSDATRARPLKMSVADAPRYLLKNVDAFAGFGHCVGTYVAGVSIAHRHNLQLIHRPLQAAHGLGYVFDDLFMLTGRIAPPVAAPTLEVASGGAALLVNGRRTSIYVLADRKNMKANASTILDAAQSLPADTILWIRKGRFSMHEDDPTATPAAQRYAGLWLRERFWQALYARAAAAGLAGAPSPTSGGGPVRVVLHVRRGDVYYLGPKTGRPHPHYVESGAVLEVLAGVREAVGEQAWGGRGRTLTLPLTPTLTVGEQAWAGVELDVETERGWLHNDTRAVRALLPGARINLGDDRRPHLAVEAMLRMSTADIFLMGSSGFSTWAAVFQP